MKVSSKKTKTGLVLEGGAMRGMYTAGVLVGNQFCYHELPDTLDPYDHEAFKKSETDFYVVCTNLETGKPGKHNPAKIFYKKYPKFAACLEKRASEYNRMAEDLRQLEKRGEIFVIRPETPLAIGRMSHDRNKITGAYARGRADGETSLKKMCIWLEQGQ